VNFGRTLFSQVMDFVPWTSFGRLVAKYDGDLRVRKFRCTEQFRNHRKRWQARDTARPRTRAPGAARLLHLSSSGSLSFDGEWL
jgi:hypothetical protein